ncbi:GD11640 [Drosophila simulans]|uniref:Gustatory receptor n=1 Tax=Drosophila simulans TaxID=7240 RepID=B4QH06_DROSI|nr:GD11640 [Drosophila simulans]
MLLKFMYIYGIVCGLMPAPLKKGQFLLGYKLRWYLIYTACLHGGLLTVLPFTFPHYMYDDSYMSSNPVLKWTFNLTNITRIMAMFSGVLLMWFVLHWQSERLQIALKDLCSFLNYEERNSLTLSENKADRSLGKLAKLFQLCAENQRLVREVFRTFDLPIALLLLKMFVTNVNLVYHGVQFGNESIETSSYTRILGQWVVISHYWSAVLLMNVVDDVTRRSDLKMGDLLREFSHLELVKRDFHLQLELFSDHLRCHPSTYKVCGLFIFDKQTSLAYFFYVLVQVLVLIQFDLKNKVEERN